MLGPEDDIARFEYLKKSARNFGSVEKEYWVLATHIG